MSSTRRPVRALISDDFFATPAWVVRAILPILPAEGAVLDPCCGEGAILDVINEYKRPTLGIELDEDRCAKAARRHAVTHADALGETKWPLVHCLIMNPPFSLAEEFVRKAIAWTKAPRPAQNNGDLFAPKPVAAVLLRLAFLETAKRIALHREHPSDVYPLAYRPSFTANGKCDSCAYAWFCWGGQPHREPPVRHAGREQRRASPLPRARVVPRARTPAARLASLRTLGGGLRGAART